MRGGASSAGAPDVGFDASPFSLYTSQLSAPGGEGGARPKPRALAWVMRHAEEIYDARYARDTAELRGEGGGEAAPFPSFVVEFFSKRYGLRSLIDSTAWDLLASVAALRGSSAEVELFSRFLAQELDADDLLFFLYVRSVAQKELGVSLRSRWTEMGRAGAAGGGGAAVSSSGAPPPPLLTLKEAAAVSRAVFGSEADPLYRSFMALVEEATGGGGRRGGRAAAAADRRIDVPTFLALALEEYHGTRPETVAAEAEAASSAGQQRQLGAGERAEAGAPGAGAGAAGPPSSALLEALGEAMHAANEAFVSRLLLGAEAGDARGGSPADTADAYAGLPADVQASIAQEVQNQLEGKVDALLAEVISAAGAPAPGIARLVAAYEALIAAGGAQGMDDFCDAVLAHEEVGDAMLQLTQLLVSYAAERLGQAAGQAAQGREGEEEGQ